MQRLKLENLKDATLCRLHGIVGILNDQYQNMTVKELHKKIDEEINRRVKV